MLTDEEKEKIILTRMKERGITQLIFTSCPDCGHMPGYLGKDSHFAYGECLICGRKVLIPREGKPIWGRSKHV